MSLVLAERRVVHVRNALDGDIGAQVGIVELLERQGDARRKSRRRRGLFGARHHVSGRGRRGGTEAADGDDYRNNCRQTDQDDSPADEQAGRVASRKGPERHHQRWRHELRACVPVDIELAARIRLERSAAGTARRTSYMAPPRRRRPRDTCGTAPSSRPLDSLRRPCERSPGRTLRRSNGVLVPISLLRGRRIASPVQSTAPVRAPKGLPASDPSPIGSWGRP